MNFFCNFDTNSRKTYVQGKHIEFNPHLINEYYGTPNVSEHDFGQLEVNDLTMRSEVFGREVEGGLPNGTIVCVSSLSDFYRVLTIFVNSNIDPHKHSSTMSIHRERLLYGIGNDVPVNIGVQVYNCCIDAFNYALDKGWPFASLIMHFIVQSGVQPTYDDGLLKTLSPINQGTWARSKSHSVYVEDDKMPSVLEVKFTAKVKLVTAVFVEFVIVCYSCFLCFTLYIRLLLCTL